MSFDPARLRALQIIVFGFIMGITMIMVVFSVAVGVKEYDPESDIMIFVVVGVTIMSYMSGIVAGKVMMQQLIKQSIAAGELNFGTYQTLTILKIATFEAPALMAIVFYFFFVGGTPVQGLNALLLVPVVIFYLSLISMFPTATKLNRIQEAISGAHE